MAGGLHSRLWLLVAVVLLGGCRRGASTRITLAVVERCEEGLEFASLEPTREKAMQTYLDACAAVYAEPGCRAAFVKAAGDGAELVSTVVPSCRRAYCPVLRAQHLKLCEAKEPITQADAREGWPSLHNAILTYDAGKYATRLSIEMYRFYVTVQTRFGHEANGSSR
jgi:hypothetical protein